MVKPALLPKRFGKVPEFSLFNVYWQLRTLRMPQNTYRRYARKREHFFIYVRGSWLSLHCFQNDSEKFQNSLYSNVYWQLRTLRMPQNTYRRYARKREHFFIYVRGSWLSLHCFQNDSEKFQNSLYSNVYWQLRTLRMPENTYRRYARKREHFFIYVRGSWLSLHCFQNDSEKFQNFLHSSVYWQHS